VRLAILLVAGLSLGPALHASDPVIAAAGDIACDPADPSYNHGNGTPTDCRQKATSDLLVGGGLDAVLLLGDNQHWGGSLVNYQLSFGPTWGRLGSLLRPAPGNHEYETPGAQGYFDYFGAAAGNRNEGWYSFDLGTWHVVSLNSNCAAVGGCGPGSPQVRWLEEDLAAHPRACTLAYWHHPRFTSGPHADDPTFDTLWRTLYRAGVELVLNGHDHDYERFAPQDPSGKADPAYGIREFVVGTGGRETRPFVTVRPNSEARNDKELGVLKLRLRPDGYDWQFLPVPGGAFTDAGSGGCHNPPGAEAIPLRLGGRARRRRLRAPLVLPAGELGADGEGDRRLRPERPLVGVRGGHHQRRLHPDRDRYGDPAERPLREPARTRLPGGDGREGLPLPVAGFLALPRLLL
jgi:hypothetical protein